MAFLHGKWEDTDRKNISNLRLLTPPAGFYSPTIPINRQALL